MSALVGLGAAGIDGQRARPRLYPLRCAPFRHLSGGRGPSRVEDLQAHDGRRSI